jgi:uncharacterized protein YneF (UPF0154 family)
MSVLQCILIALLALITGFHIGRVYMSHKQTIALKNSKKGHTIIIEP